METVSLTIAKPSTRILGNRLGQMLTGIGLLVGIGMILTSLLSVKDYMLLIQEDGIIENGSATLWFLAAIVSVCGFSSNRSIKRFVLVGLILFFVICGGEEISWGQRLVGFHGPEALLDVNKQHETNIHNIGSISVFSNVFLLLTVSFFVGIPWIARSSNRRWQSIKAILPTVSPDTKRIYLISFVMWVIIGLRFGTLGFHPYSLWGYYTQMDDEFFEFFAAYSFFAFSVLDVFRLPKSEAIKQN